MKKLTEEQETRLADLAADYIVKHLRHKELAKRCAELERLQEESDDAYATSADKFREAVEEIFGKEGFVKKEYAYTDSIRITYLLSVRRTLKKVRGPIPKLVIEMTRPIRLHQPLETRNDEQEEKTDGEANIS